LRQQSTKQHVNFMITQMISAESEPAHFVIQRQEKTKIGSFANSLQDLFELLY